MLRQGSRRLALPLQKEGRIPTSHCSAHPGSGERSKSHPCPMAQGPTAQGPTGEGLARLSLGRVFSQQAAACPCLEQDNQG